MKLTGIFHKLNPIKALVIGDFMLDRYTKGSVKRISLEAPVPILKVEKEEILPGGAGNVALNLKALGAIVKVIGRVGDDTNGHILKNILEDVDGLFFEDSFTTSIKNRFIADSQQLLRVDFEDVKPLSQSVEEKVLNSLQDSLEGIDVVAVSDYAKGFLSDSILEKLFKESKRKNIPVIVDPKGTNFSKYKGATILKPNRLEALGAAKTTSLDEAAKIILKKTLVDHLLITLSEDGIALFQKESRQNFPVRVKEVKDVTGAGDTVLATLSFALANKIPIEKAIELSNLAAGIAIEKVGCARVSLEEIAKRLLEESSENKIFEASHLSILKATSCEKMVILDLGEETKVTEAVCKAIYNLSKNKRGKLLLWIDKNSSDEMIDILASFRGVDFIILKDENIEKEFSNKGHDLHRLLL